LRFGKGHLVTILYLLLWWTKIICDLFFRKIKDRSTNWRFWNYCSRFRFSLNSSAELQIRHDHPLKEVVVARKLKIRVFNSQLSKKSKLLDQILLCSDIFEQKFCNLNSDLFECDKWLVKSETSSQTDEIVFSKMYLLPEFWWYNNDTIDLSYLASESSKTVFCLYFRGLNQNVSPPRI
jgi:hypothetical protein